MTLILVVLLILLLCGGLGWNVGWWGPGPAGGIFAIVIVILLLTLLAGPVGVYPHHHWAW